MPDKKLAKKIFFPQRISTILYKILEQYQVVKPEAKKTIVEQPLMAIQLINIIAEIKRGDLNEKDLCFEIEERLGISKQKAEKIGKAIKDKSLLIQERPTPVAAQPKSEEKKKKKYPGDKDIYREPIE